MIKPYSLLIRGGLVSLFLSSPFTAIYAEVDFSNLDVTSNSLTDGIVGPPPREDALDALPTPTNGAQPTSHGFAFDIEDDQLTWRFGPSIIRNTGNTELEMYCSEDGIEFKALILGNDLTGTIPCAGEYTYFFRYAIQGQVTDSPSSRFVYTGAFTTVGERVDPNNYTPFTDGSANWMRFRHPHAHDGTNVAVLDAQHNSDRLRNLARYTIHVDDSPGNVELNIQLANGNVLRVESMERGDNRNGQPFMSVNQNPGFGNVYSYGQVISFEFTAIAGLTGAQTYNDFTNYTVGLGFGPKYGDPRLQAAGKASSSSVFADGVQFEDLEKNAVFTQPFVTIHEQDLIDDFIVGHHLFHGIDPNKQGSTLFDDPDVQVGTATCGECHFRDGRGTEVFETAKGPRLPQAIFGVKLLEVIEGRESGFARDGSTETVAQQVINALLNDHGVEDINNVPEEVLRLLTAYTEVITVPARDPESYDTPGVTEGDLLFNDIGCASCHTPVQRTRSDVEPHLRNLTIRPYTDMKNHFVNGESLRTTPLWGLSHNLEILERNGLPELYMHDGGASSVEEAIQLHSGDASDVRDAFNELSEEDQTNIVRFVRSL